MNDSIEYFDYLGKAKKSSRIIRPIFILALALLLIKIILDLLTNH